MLEVEVVDLVNAVLEKKCEDNYLEIKSAYKGAPKIFDTLSSFSNQNDGGIIIFGIDESDYSVCGVYDAGDLQKKISESCLQMEPVVRALCSTAQIGDKTVVVAEIPEIEAVNRPCFYTGAGRTKGSHIRVGDADQKMTEYEVYSYEAFRQKIEDELRITQRGNLAHIQSPYFDEYMVKLAVAKPNFANMSMDHVLELQGFAFEEKPTLAGVMLFSEYPQSFYPRLCITAVVVPGTEVGDLSDGGERFIDNQSIEGTIPQMLNQAIAFVRRNMATSTIIDPETGLRQDKTEYPITAIREIVLNALIHRDYSIHTDSAPIIIQMFTDRIEIANPGGLYGRMTLDTLGTMGADTRNPCIARALEVTKDTENRFSGIPTIKKEMAKANLPEPVFQSFRGNFKVTLYNKTWMATQFAKTVKKWDEVFEADLSTAILEFCKQAKTRDEIVEQFNHVGRSYLLTQYVNPLVEANKLSLTIPDKPKSKKQKFITNC